LTESENSTIPYPSTSLNIAISILCISLLVIHALFPNIVIDNVTLGLIIIIIFIWMAPLISSIKLPGGTELAFKEKVKKLEKISEGSEDLKAVFTVKQPPYVWITDPKSDPNLALAGLRIEIEKKVREIIKKNGIASEKQSLRGMVRLLYENQIVPHNEYEILYSIIDIGNKAVHGEKVDLETAYRILNIGEKVLFYLDKKLTNKFN